MHGMPVGLLLDEMNYDHLSIPGMEWLDKSWKGDENWPTYKEGESPPRLPSANIVYVGLRDVDLKERQVLRDLYIRAIQCMMLMTSESEQL